MLQMVFSNLKKKKDEKFLGNSSVKSNLSKTRLFKKSFTHMCDLFLESDPWILLTRPVNRWKLTDRCVFVVIHDLDFPVVFLMCSKIYNKVKNVCRNIRVRRMFREENFYFLFFNI